MDVITLGETMVLFDPITDGSLRYVDRFSKRIGGAESNVAIGMVRLGKEAGWVSKLGDDSFGNYILSSIRGEGVDTSSVIITDEQPTGIYIKERLRENQTQVYYYRKNSAASNLAINDIDWDYISKAKLLHISGITPLLSENSWRLTQEAFNFAKKNNIEISFDPNIRTKLWDKPEEAKKRLLYLSEKCDILLIGLDEASILLGIEEPDDILSYFKTKDVTSVIIKNGSVGSYYYSENDGRGFVSSFDVERVVDPVGAGDGFAAGVLSTLLEKKTLKEAVTIGSIIGAMVISTYGDIEGLPDRRAIEQFLYEKRDIIR